jgi:nitrogenase subunit NifH
MDLKSCNSGKYTRTPMNCKACRIEHRISIFHIGSDPNADCAKCIVDETFRNVQDVGARK